MLSLIAAMADHRVIGVDNTIPWRIKNDMKHFKNITTGKPIIMGRKTYESIGMPLPNRTNIVVTQNTEYTLPGCLMASSIKDGITIANSIARRDNVDAIIIGGSSLYEAAIPIVDNMYITHIEGVVPGDTYFPEVNWDEWTEISREDFEPAEGELFSYSFSHYTRNSLHT